MWKIQIIFFFRVFQQAIFSVYHEYFFLLRILLIFVFTFLELIFLSKVKNLLILIEVFLGWKLQLFLWYLLTIAGCVFQNKKNIGKNYNKNLVWWYKWATTCIFIVLQTWSLRTEISVWNKNILLITDALLIKSLTLDILMFPIKCP